MGGGGKERKVRQQSEGYSEQLERQEKWGAGIKQLQKPSLVQRQSLKFISLTF